MDERPQTFRLTQQHIALIRDMRVGWDDSYAGAPAIECREPYLSGAAVEAVISLAGIKSEVVSSVIERGAVPRRVFMPDARAQRAAMTLHRETDIALQIVLSVGEFAPGLYRRVDHDGYRWERVR